MYATGFPTSKDRIAAKNAMIQCPTGKCGLVMNYRWSALAVVEGDPRGSDPYRAVGWHQM